MVRLTQDLLTGLHGSRLGKFTGPGSRVSGSRLSSAGYEGLLDRH